VIDEHDALLGRSLSHITTAARRDDRLDTDETCGHLRRAYLAGQGDIALTTNGIAGDEGTYGNAWVSTWPDRSTQRRMRSAEAYRLARRSRHIVRQVPRATVTHALPLLSTFVGVDNRQWLPPFLPVYRNDEAIFGFLLAKCRPTSYAGHLPWTLQHLPTWPRPHAPEVLSSIRISDIVLVGLSSCAPAQTSDSPDERLQALGRHLIELGSQPQADFDAHLRSLLTVRAARILDALQRHQRRLAGHVCPEWDADLRGHVQRVADAMGRAGYVTPIDLRTHGPTVVARRVRQFVRRCGELCAWWPALRAQAAAVRVRDDGFSRGH
jgi:hypothetical protein